MARAVACVLLAGGAARAADDLVDEPVSIAGLDLMPPRGIAAWDGYLRLHPKLLVGAGYDSNPRSTTEGTPSAALRVGGGLDARLAFDADNRLSLRSEAVHTAYPSLHEADLEAYSLNLRLAHTGRIAAAGVAGGLSRINDPLPETGERIPRLVAEAAIDGSLTRDELTAGADVTVAQTRYLEDSRDFTAEDRDNRNIVGTVWWRAPAEGRPAAYLEAELDRRRFDTDRVYNDATGAGVLAGVDGPLSDKLRLRLLAGPQWRWYAADFRHAPAYDDSRSVILAADGSLTWQADERWDLQLGGRRLLDDGIRANSVTLLQLRSNAGYMISRRVRCGLGFDQERATDSGSAAAEPRNQRITNLWHLTLDWRPRPGLLVEARVDYARSASIVDEDYDRVIAGVRIAAAL